MGLESNRPYARTLLDPRTSIAEMYAAGDVLAYIAGRLEEEIVVLRERVGSTGAHTGARRAATGRRRRIGAGRCA
jgi:thioredoxin reductase